MTRSIHAAALAALACALLVPLLVPAGVRAFCGFYVSGADASLYNNATMVVMMREGTRTVLSMQNNYQGPPEDFAMVVPVPVVLQEENVKTLPKEIFQRIDQLAAPRLVEYWEQDPCRPQMQYEMMAAAPMADTATGGAEDEGADLGVTVEAEFAVGEYDIQILSANDSSGLDTWLRRENYNIPEGTGRVLRPYVEQGTKFFVAKVDTERVQFVNGQAVLSPLRVHYDTPEFWLPVRLGLLNSAGKQDLIVHILSRGTRYEVANYENATIPTNIRMTDAVRDEFGAVYDALFERTIAANPRTVVTEYSWDASTCDPCPTQPLNPSELTTLGADVIPNNPVHGFVLTRLHYRYTANDLGEDLVFRAATPIVGGRGTPDQEGMLQQGVQPGSINNFQGRYAILHEWEGPMDCENPMRGSWGGPPDGRQPEPRAAASRLNRTGGGPAPTPGQLGVLVEQDIPEIGVVRGQVVADENVVVDRGPSQTPPPAAEGEGGGCAGCTVTDASAGLGGGLLAGLVLVALLRRRRG